MDYDDLDKIFDVEDTTVDAGEDTPPLDDHRKVNFADAPAELRETIEGILGFEINGEGINVDFSRLDESSYTGFLSQFGQLLDTLCRVEQIETREAIRLDVVIEVLDELTDGNASRKITEKTLIAIVKLRHLMTRVHIEAMKSVEERHANNGCQSDHHFERFIQYLFQDIFIEMTQLAIDDYVAFCSEQKMVVDESLIETGVPLS